jgi:NADPH:quinone reductase-like Zn-dependent oxidoreductase
MIHASGTTTWHRPATPLRRLLETETGGVASGRITVPVQRTYALAEVPHAFHDFMGGTIGKLTVTI